LKIGKKWSQIAKNFEGKTGDMVKNRFYSSIKKQLIRNEESEDIDDSKGGEYQEIYQNFEEFLVKKSCKRKRTVNQLTPKNTCASTFGPNKDRISSNFNSSSKLPKEKGIIEQSFINNISSQVVSVNINFNNECNDQKNFNYNLFEDACIRPSSLNNSYNEYSIVDEYFCYNL